MPKINNMVRIVEFATDSDLYSLLDRNLVSHIDESDTRCYKLKHIELLNRTHAILYFEEDLDVIMTRFIYDKIVLELKESHDSDAAYFSVQELLLLDEVGAITIEGKIYEIDEIEYVMDFGGVRHADIYLS